MPLKRARVSQTLTRRRFQLVQCFGNRCFLIAVCLQHRLDDHHHNNHDNHDNHEYNDHDGHHQTAVCLFTTQIGKCICFILYFFCFKLQNIFVSHCKMYLSYVDNCICVFVQNGKIFQIT